MIRWTLLGGVAFLLIVGIFGVLISPDPLTSYVLAQAASPTPTPTREPFGGLDVVFLIDQSGSMIGSREHPEPNDKDGKRRDLMLYFISRLGDDILVYNPDAVHRMAVISFGTTARVDIPETGTGFAEIRPRDPASWNATRESLERQVPRLVSMGDTDPLRALKLAKTEIFDKAPPVYAGLRRKAIVLVTDGCPFLRTESFTPTVYMKELKTYWQKDFGEDYYLFVVGLNDAAGTEGDNYWLECGPLWEEMVKSSHAGSMTRLVKVNEDPAAVVIEVFDKALPSPPGLVPDPKHIPVLPYLQKAILVISKKKPAIDVTILRPDGSILKDRSLDPTSELIEHTQHGTIERFVLRTPKPGLWQVVPSGDIRDISVFLYKASARIRLTEPVAPQPQGNSVTIVYSIVISDPETITKTILFEEDRRNYPLTLTTTLKDPNGKDTPINMKPGAASEYRSAQPVSLPLPGDYWLTVVGQARDPEGKELEVLRDDTGHIEAYEVFSFDFAIDKPKSNDKLDIHTGLLDGFKPQPIPVEVRLLKQGQIVEEPASILTGNLNATFVARLFGPAESVPPEEFFLKYDHLRHLFVGSLESKLDQEGTYRLEVSLQQGTWRYDYRPQDNVRKVNFTRQLPLDRPLIWEIAGAIVGLVLLIVFAFLLWFFTGGPQGVLSFKSEGIPVFEPINLGRHRRHVRISARELANKYSVPKDELDLEGISVRKTQQGIKITVKDKTGVFLDDELADGEDMSLGKGWAISYNRYRPGTS